MSLELEVLTFITSHKASHTSAFAIGIFVGYKIVMFILKKQIESLEDKLKKSDEKCDKRIKDVDERSDREIETLKNIMIIQNNQIAELQKAIVNQ